MKEWSEEVAAARKRVLERERIGSRLKSLRSHEEQLEQAVATERERVALEGRDFEKLQGLRLTSLVHTLLGNKKLKLAEERRQLDRAQARHDGTQAELEFLRRRIEQLETRRDELNAAESEFESSLADYERELAGPAGEAAAALRACVDEEANGQERARHLDELILHASSARRTLTSVVESLDTAGQWEFMVVGGIVSSWVKHGHIGEAKENLRSAQRDLTTLRRKIDEMELDLPDADPEIAGYDDFFREWTGQEQVEECKENVGKTIRQLNRLQNRLERLAGKTRKRAAAAKVRRREILEGA